MFVKTISDKIF